jgi:chromosome segregation ATPase
MWFRKWRERDAAKLRKLEKRFDELQRKYDSIESSYYILRSDIRSVEKRVAEKEVTHIQKVRVELTEPINYGGWYP